MKCRINNWQGGETHTWLTWEIGPNDLRHLLLPVHFPAFLRSHFNLETLLPNCNHLSLRSSGKCPRSSPGQRSRLPQTVCCHLRTNFASDSGGAKKTLTSLIAQPTASSAATLKVYCQSTHNGLRLVPDSH